LNSFFTSDGALMQPGEILSINLQKSTPSRSCSSMVSAFSEISNALSSHFLVSYEDERNDMNQL
jgi:hypothetical protein